MRSFRRPLFVQKQTNYESISVITYISEVNENCLKERGVN